MLVVILVGLTAFALLAARFVGVDPTSLWPLGEVGHEDFWRRVLPWPHGVQEDDEIAWHVPLATPQGTGGSGRSVSMGRPVPPTRPQRRMAGR
jgi:hypothetical protein